MRKLQTIIPLAAALFLVAGISGAEAGAVTYDFNSLASGVTSGGIQTYMQTLLSGQATATIQVLNVNGTNVSTVQTDRTYTGDGHVVGPYVSGTATPLTLGTSDGATQHLTTYDTFIRNNTSYTGWEFVFSGIIIDSVQFDYEIFPDGACPKLTNCGASLGNGLYANQPDFTFSTDLGTVFHYYANKPGGTANAATGLQAGSTYNESPCTDNNTTNTCINPSGTSTEPAPQLIGTTSLLNVGGATTLKFVDWPAMIGIDNLVINFHTPPGGGGGGQSPVPEPATLLLVGGGLAAALRRRKRQA